MKKLTSLSQLQDEINKFYRQNGKMPDVIAFTPEDYRTFLDFFPPLLRLQFFNGIPMKMQTDFPYSVMMSVPNREEPKLEFKETLENHKQTDKTGSEPKT